MRAVAAFACIPAVVIGLVIVLILAVAPTSTARGAGCGTAAAPAGEVLSELPDTVGRWNTAQVQMAAVLVGAAHTAQMNEQATTILVMTAMGESSLQNLTHGDAVDNTTIGVLQQGASYGPRQNRLDPAIAGTAFLDRLLGVAGWEAMEPTLAAHKVQRNADPYHYAPFWVDAQTMVAAVTGSATTSGCDISGDAQELAQILAAAWEAGTFTNTYHPQMVTEEILPLASGTARPGCEIDVRVLQLLVASLNTFGSIQISDLNRPCVGITTNCPLSLHCKTPAFAVDYNAVGGRVLLGGNTATLEFLRWADTVLPDGSRAGQVQCRPGTTFTHISQFTDACTHQHLDFGQSTQPLQITAL